MQKIGRTVRSATVLVGYYFEVANLAARPLWRRGNGRMQLFVAAKLSMQWPYIWLFKVLVVYGEDQEQWRVDNKVA